MEGMINVVLIDDDAKTKEILDVGFGKNWPEVSIQNSFSDPQLAIPFLEENKVDCVFLGIDLPNMNGFEVLKHFPNRKFLVVFLASDEKYAVQAIRENVHDYITKPIDNTVLNHSIQRLKREINQRIYNGIRNRLQKILVPVEGKFIFLASEEIIYCESDGNYCRIYLCNNKTIFVAKKLKDIESLLPQNIFFRVHNQYVANLTKIREFLRSDSYIVLENNIKIPVARNRRTDFLDMF